MLAWMLYVIMVTLLLSIGALLAERATRLNRRGARWIWVMAIATSLGLPMIVDALKTWPPAQAPQLVSEPGDLHQAIVQTISPAAWIVDGTATSAARQDFDSLLRALWIGASASLLLLLVGGRVHLALRTRRWHPSTLAGVPVLLSDDLGPAVVGSLRPRIVLPRWVLDAPRAQQAAVLAHEQAHLDARDPQLFTLAFVSLIVMPWNLPLWWQLQRLRRAIEVDCDARVLAGGIDTTSYGEALISVGAHRASPVVALAAASGSHSFLEQRLRIMLSKPVKWRRTATVALAGTSFCLAALAAQVSPPAASTPASAPTPAATSAQPQAGRTAIKLPTATLDRYLGYYTQADAVIYEVRRQGDHLLADSSAGPKMELLAASEDHFFLKDSPDAEFIFANDGSGKAPSAVLRQMGQDLPITRVDAAAVARFKSQLDARRQAQAPSPGTEATLRRLLTSLDSGTPDYSNMQPLLAEAVRRDLPTFVAAGKQMGPIQSIQFTGVDGGGWDVYEVQRTHARFQHHIMLDSDGRIAGYFSTQP